MNNKNVITIEAIVDAPIEKVWSSWNNPDDIVKWSHASDDWHTTKASNDLVIGGKFSSRMEAKDGSMGFDFEGVYSNVKTNELIEYAMADGRTVKVVFAIEDGKTKVVESFDPENENPLEMQQMGWQTILNNFKKYTESK